MFQETYIKFMCISHVDVGKSSLIGNFMVLTDNVDKHEVSKIGEVRNLLDTNEEERERGITQYINIVEVHYNNINYEIIDCPGHEMYIRETVSALINNSDSIVCVLLSAVRNEFDSGFMGGTTKEDVILAKACGIKHIIVLINKIDKIIQDEDSVEKYNYVMNTFKSWVQSLNFKSCLFIPISGYLGWNIVNHNNELDVFYSDSDTLINGLNSIHKKRLNNSRKKIDKVYKKKDKIKVDFYAFNVSNLITLGYQCVIHIGEIECICNLAFIESENKRKRFLKSGEKAFIGLLLDKEVTVYNFQKVILRCGNSTIGFGEVVLNV